jgi:hypothetical protein
LHAAVSELEEGEYDPNEAEAEAEAEAVAEAAHEVATTEEREAVELSANSRPGIGVVSNGAALTEGLLLSSQSCSDTPRQDCVSRAFRLEQVHKLRQLQGSGLSRDQPALVYPSLHFSLQELRFLQSIALRFGLQTAEHGDGPAR